MSTSSTIYDKYKAELTTILHDITIGSLGKILTDLTNLVPQMMMDAGKIRTASGQEKKQIIISAINMVITDVSIGVGSPELTGIIINVVDKLIDQLIEVENGNLVFNPKVSKFCCGK